MSTRRNNEQVDAATELEIRAIWGSYETVYFRESKTTASDIHLYKDCQAFPNEDYEPQEKSLSVYPRGFKDICGNCLFRYRKGD